MCDEYVVTLKVALSSLSVKFPFTITLNALLERDFKLISQREAYETLRYLLTACGRLVELNDNTFADVRWKSVEPETKKRIEKCKNYVIDTIKDLRKDNKIIVPSLKKSDLLVPYCAMFFSSCLAFANYALSYQLNKYGVYFWPSMIQQTSFHVQVRRFALNLQEEEKNNFESQMNNFSKEIEMLDGEIFKMKEKKVKFSLLLENEINKCKYKCDLGEESARSKIIASWKVEIDDLHASNLQKIKLIEDLNEHLSILNRLMVRKEKFIIDGEELTKNIPFEVKHFTEMNGLAICSENYLNLPELFKTVNFSIPKTIKNKEIISELLAIKPPNFDTKLLHNLEIKKKKLEEIVESFHHNLGENVETEALCWLADFFPHVSKINFSSHKVLVAPKDPIFDEEKLLRTGQFNDKNSQHKDGIDVTKTKGNEILKNFPDISRRNSKKKVGGTLKGVKRDSKKWLNTKRKSISLKSLSSLSSASFKSLNSEKVGSASEEGLSPQGLCSTPKESCNRSFIDDGSISPISLRDTFVRSHNRITEDSVTNVSILTESDIHGYLLNSYLSTDFDSKADKREGTFEYTTSIQDISLDPTPSQLSINLSTL